MEQMQGKVAVVTGAASGIGLAMATAFAAEGMNLVVADIESGPLTAAAGAMPAGIEVLTEVCDVSDAAQVDALRDAAVERFGTVHVVCNNAGVGSGGLAWEVPLDEWRWVLGVNLWGVIHGIRSFTPLLIAQGEGHIVNTASMAGLTSPPFMSPYNVSKHSVVTLSETLHSDLTMVGAAGVGVSVLCPGWVRTRIHESARNRPTGDVAPSEGEAPADLSGIIAGLIADGLDPNDVAARVVDAVRTNSFYVLTHPDWNSTITDRTQRMVEGQPPAITAIP